MNKPLVSIICFTYEHEAFILETINGFLSQKTSFTFEIIVHDDASHDSTQSILRECEQSNVGFFKNIYQKSNQYSISPNLPFIAALESAEGKYIALCEGDDYWTDPLKLQKQVDFLEANPQASCITHNVQLLHNNGLGSVIPNIGDRVLNTRDILFERDYNYLPTCSYVFRQSFFARYESRLQQYVDFGDWPLIFQLSLMGDVYHINEVMGVYRKHASGYTSINNSSVQLRINNFYLAVGILYPEYWNDCQAKMKMLEKKIYVDREKELKSQDFIVNNNGLKKLLKILFKKIIFTLKTILNN
jgi:glycosyltransferase involved in cell wall biosynthesis